jgi:hypothetical protein
MMAFKFLGTPHRAWTPALLLTLLLSVLVASGCSADEPKNDADGADTTAAEINGLDAIAKLPPAPPGADTIPIRTEDGGAARYGIPMAEVEQEYTGHLAGMRMLVFDQWGMREKKIEKFEPAIKGRPGPSDNTVRITTPEKFMVLNMGDKTGFWDVNDGDEMYMNDDTLQNISLGDFLFQMSQQYHKGDTTINGYNLKMYEELGGGFKVVRWMWRGITLAEHFMQTGIKDPDEFWVITKSINLNPPIFENTFDAPADYKLTKGPPPNPMMGGPNGAPPPPGAAPPAGGAPAAPPAPPSDGN